MSPLAALWTSWFITAFNPVMGSYAVRYTHAFVYVFLSCVFCFLFFIPYINKNKKWSILFDKKNIFPLFMAGTFGTALPMAIIMYALNFTTPANASIFNQVEIVYSLVFSFIFLKERPSWQQLGGSLLVLAGVGVILFNDLSSIKWQGDLMVVGAVWMFQVSHVFVKKLPKEFDYKTITAARVLYSVPALVAAIAILAFTSGIQFNLTWSLAGALAYNSALNYGLGNLFWYTAIRNMDLSKATGVILSYPCMTFVISVALGVEKGHLYQVIGLALAFSGAYWITTLVKKQKTKEELAASAAER